jgi:hypothetical protein
MAGSDLAPPFHQLKSPQPAQGVVETAPIRFVSGLCSHFFFGECIGKRLGECFQNEPFGFSQPDRANNRLTRDQSAAAPMN